MGPAEPHLRFHRAVRGAIVAEANFDSYRERETGWADVREAWMRPQRNGRPTPWEGLVGRAGAREGEFAAAGGGRMPQRPGLGHVPGEAGGSRLTRSTQSTYHYEIPVGTSTPWSILRGSRLWRYDGQQVFAEPRQAPRGRWVPAEPPGVERDRAANELALDERLFLGRDVAVDSLGRRWLAAGVDDEGHRRTLSAYRRRVAAAVPAWSPHGPGQRGAATPRLVEGADEAEFVEYDAGGCKGDNAKHPLEKEPTPFNDRARKNVWLLTNCGGYACSGTMIDDRHVLTAAHCLVHAGAGEGYLDPARMAMCSYANNEKAAGDRTYEIQCRTIGWIHTNCNALESGGGSMACRHDYGIATLTTVITGRDTFGWMAMMDSDWGIDSQDDHFRGYPGTRNDCDDNQCPRPKIMTFGWSECTLSDLGCRAAYKSSGPVREIRSGEIIYAVSAKGGMSGGGHYYCPTADCGDGHYLTGVHSLHTGKRSCGAKVSSFYDWAAGYAFNYE